MALFIVATPIGNKKDITLRALETLNSVNLILCEDTRHSKKLLVEYNIKKPTLSFYEHNEIAKTFEIIEKLKKGQNIALISDAGTPLISDPGFKLVSAARKEKIEVIPIPGPSSLTAALSIAGLPTDKFLFVGYLPKTAGKRTIILQKLSEIKKILPQSLVFFESPHRINKTLDELRKIFPQATVALARELTKMHEEVIVEKISNLINIPKTKGEFTIILY